MKDRDVTLLVILGGLGVLGYLYLRRQATASGLVTGTTQSVTPVTSSGTSTASLMGQGGALLDNWLKSVDGVVTGASNSGWTLFQSMTDPSQNTGPQGL